MPKPIEHNTPAGYQQERKRGLDICPGCRAAQTAYINRYRHNREYQRRADLFVTLGVAQ